MDLLTVRDTTERIWVDYSVNTDCETDDDDNGDDVEGRQELPN